MVDLSQIEGPADIRIRVGAAEISLNNGMSEVSIFKTWNGGESRGVMIPRHLMPPDRSWTPATIIGIRGREAVVEFPVGNEGRTRWNVPLSVLESWLEPQPDFERFEAPRHIAVSIEHHDTMLFTNFQGYAGVILRIGPSEHGAVVHRSAMNSERSQLFAHAYGRTPMRTALRIDVMGDDHVKWLVDTEGLADKTVDLDTLVGDGHERQIAPWRCPAHPEVRPRRSQSAGGFFCPARLGQSMFCPNTSMNTPSAPYHPKRTEEATP